MNKFTLLTDNTRNTKFLKGIKYGYACYGLSLAPAKLSGYNVCPMATNGCKFSCINTSGKGIFQNVQDARIKRTKWFFENRTDFLKNLSFDIQIAIIEAARKNLIPTFRLNTFSDLPFENYDIIEQYPTVQFFDYTKIFRRLLPESKASKLKNYHLTFSASENNISHVKLALQMKKNVAVVFKNELPKTYLGKKVVNGDIHDLRFLDPKNIVVGLTAKGRAKYDESGFVVDNA